MRSSDAAGERRPLRPNLPALIFALMTVPVVMTASITLTFRSAGTGVALTGANTNNAGLSFGAVSKYGLVVAGATRTTGVSNYTLSSPFIVHLQRISEPSTLTYTLSARLVGAPNVFTWKVNGFTLTTSFATLSTSMDYGNSTHTLEMVIADADTAGLSPVQGIEFFAIAN